MPEKKEVTLYAIEKPWGGDSPRIVRASAIETEKMYRITNRGGRAFGYRTNISKGDSGVSLTAQDAIDAYCIKCEKSIASLEEKLAGEKNLLEAARKLSPDHIHAPKN